MHTKNFSQKTPKTKLLFFFFLVTGSDLQKQKGPHLIFRQQINLSELVGQMEEI